MPIPKGGLHDFGAIVSRERQQYTWVKGSWSSMDRFKGSIDIATLRMSPVDVLYRVNDGH